MKCTNCGKRIGIEDKVCPYCKAENPLAGQHEENIKRYDKRFQKTKGEVLDSAKKLEGLGVRAIILVVLVIGILFLVIAASLNYADPDPEKEKEADAIRHSKEYAEIMDDYLEAGDYVDFAAFVYSHKISFWNPPYDRFVSVKYCAAYYYECIRHMESVILHSTDPDYFDRMDLDISHFCGYLQEFQQTYEVQRVREKNSTYQAYIEDMEQELRALVRTYLGMNDSEVDEFIKLSEAKMAVRMEEVLHYE